MSGRSSQAPLAPQNPTASNANLDYINGHGALPDTPAAVPAPSTQTGKKSKNKKAPDANDVGKALAAKINQLELDQAGEKDQELEIGGFSSSAGTRESILGCMKELDLPPDMIAQAMRLLNADGGPKPILQGGPPTPEKMEPLLADLAGVSDLLSALPNLFTAAQQKLTTLPPGLVATLEREVKKATRDLTSLLNQMDNPLAKLETAQKKYSELLSDMRRLDRENAKNKKRADLYQKEKDQGRSQLTKSDAVKSKLEGVCRELQRENKKLKDEQKRIENDEKASREEVSDRADSLFWELDESMLRTENPPQASSTTHLEADEMFRQRFKSFVEQYELRELHVVSMLRTKDSEVQLATARAEEQRKRAENEANKARTLTTQVSTFSHTESELRGQLNIYVEKFKQVEDTLNNSNDLFLTFRKEMEEMSKKTKRLEKENLNLTRKHELTNRNILEMAEERTKINKEVEHLRKKNNTLESIVRKMQEQGRTPAPRGGGAGGGGLEGDEEVTESDYEDDEEDEDFGSEEEGDYDVETDEELQAAQAQAQAPPQQSAVYGPPPPGSSSASSARVNGGGVHRPVNGEINGIKSNVAV